jgi:pyridoxamine 5'-phosphate oxidase
MAAQDPIQRFRDWFEDAKQKEPTLPEAVALATADGSGAPSVRMVLLKAVDDNGFVFYTNLESRKALEIAENNRAALLFHWKSISRQVRIEGMVTPVDPAEADAYFATRPRGAQIGAWASDQSRVMKTRFDLEKRVATFTAKHAVGTVPRPDHWSGYRVAPERLEFWSEATFRLHEREVFIRDGGEWRTERLFP